MSDLRNEIIKLITEERDKQLNSPVSSQDQIKTKNDWTAKIGYYLFETSSRPDKHVSFEEFRESLIKAGALILGALETSFNHEKENEIKDILKNINKDDHE